MKKKELIILIISMLFLLLFIIGVILNRNGYIFNFDSWTPIPANIMLFSLFGLFLFIFLMIKFKNIYLKLIFILSASFSLIFLGYIALFGSSGYSVVENEDYKVYVNEYRFLFAGADTFYLKENFLVARKVATADQSEECHSAYRLDDNQLIIVESCESGSSQTITVDLD